MQQPKFFCFMFYVLCFMNITWYGQTCFRINTLKNRNGSVDMLIDPFEKDIGLRPPKTEADIILITRNTEKTLSGNFFLINGPGEYDAKGVYIQGISCLSRNVSSKNEDVFGETTIYTIEAEKMKICHLGKLGQKELLPDQIEKIGKIDILMIPIGGKEALEPEDAVKIMSQIEPKIIIPMYYQIPKLKIKLGGLDKFLKSLGVKSLEPLTKLSVKKKDISEEEAKIITLRV